MVIDALPEKHRIRDRAARARLEQLEAANDVERFRLFIEMAGARAMTASELAARTGAADEQIADYAGQLVKSGQVIEIASSPLLLLSKEAYSFLALKLTELLEAYHKREPLSLGLSREEARERIYSNLKPEVFRACVARLAEEGKIVAERDALRLKSHKLELSAGDEAAKQALEAAIRKLGLQAGTLEEVASSAGINVDRARKFYNLLMAERKVQRIGDFVFHADAIEDLKSRVQAQKKINPKIDVAVFKEITGGLTRKYAIPLLEFLDRERVTRRMGNEREIL
jgi:selenocysteine-specific elongation factor